MKMQADSLYDVKALKKYLIIIAIFSGLSYVTKGYVFIVLPFFVFSALTKRNLVDLLFWVMILSFTGVANPYLFPKTPITFVIARLSLGVVSLILMLRTAGRKDAKIVAPLAGIFVYIAWEAIISAQGFDPIVSYLKIILFIPIYLAFYSVANEVTTSIGVDSRAIRSAILAMACFVVFGSMALWPFPSVSQLMVRSIDDVAQISQMVAEGHSLFMGVTNHSQALGPVLGVFLAVVFGDLIFAIKKFDLLYVLILLFGFFLVVKTSSRTSMAAFVAGLIVMTWLLNLARNINTRWKGKVMAGIWLFAILMVFIVFSVPSVRKRVMEFALKRYATGTEIVSSDLTYENITSSRQGLIDVAMENYKKKPLTGNGFQVSEDMQYEHRHSFWDYMSAPIEKGVWLSAVLEEGGFPGLIFFGGFLMTCFFTLIRRRAYLGAGSLFVLSIVNLGEFTFFSLSYAGGFEWFLVFAAVTLDGQRINGEISVRNDWQSSYDYLRNGY